MKTLMMTHVMMFFCLSVVAQPDWETLTFGPKAGINISNLGGDVTDNISAKLRWHVGGFASVLISEKIGAQAELIYSAQGARDEFNPQQEQMRISLLTI